MADSSERDESDALRRFYARGAAASLPFEAHKLNVFKLCDTVAALRAELADARRLLRSASADTEILGAIRDLCHVSFEWAEGEHNIAHWAARGLNGWNLLVANLRAARAAAGGANG